MLRLIASLSSAPIRALAVAAVCGFFAACQSVAPRAAAPEPIAGAEWTRPGFSGAAPFGAAILVVHDAKFDATLPRLGVIELPALGPARYHAVTVSDWRGRMADDLEALCRLPGGDNHFLAVESSHRTGAPARLIHLSVTGNAADGWRVIVEGVATLPRSPEATPIADPANYEGLACLPAPAAAQILVLLGDRGGSRESPFGALRWFALNPDTMQITSDAAGLAGLEVRAPGDWRDMPGVRAIADLAVDSAGVVWASATRDPGDAGPFESRIYPIARLADGSAAPVAIEPGAVRWRLDGVKVEALARLADDRWFFATDDEAYGGAFGFLPLTTNDHTSP